MAPEYAMENHSRESLLNMAPGDRPLMSCVVLTLENGSTRLPAPNNPGHFGQTSSDVEQIRDGTENSMNSLTLTTIEGR